MNHKAIIVIRTGEHGAMTLSRFSKPRWFPPFHDSQSSRIVDTTGAGNMFLGGFTVSPQVSGDLGDAAICGTVAASFAVEQIGLPAIHAHSSSETWNGTTVASRLAEYRERFD